MTRATRPALTTEELARLPVLVEHSRLARLPPDLSALMRLPLDPDSAVEREFFGRRIESEDVDEPPASERPPRSWGRAAVLLVGLAVAAGSAAAVTRSLPAASVPPMVIAAAPRAAPPPVAAVEVSAAASAPVAVSREAVASPDSAFREERPRARSSGQARVRSSRARRHHHAR